MTEAVMQELVRAQIVIEELRTALALISIPKRPDGTWNRDRQACQQLAEQALRDSYRTDR